MSPHARFPRVSARVGALIIRRASVLGVEPAQLIGGTGFDEAWLSETEARVPLAMEELLWARAAELTHRPTFGLFAASQIRPGEFDVLDYAVRTAPDLRTALQRLARYNRLVHDLAVFEIIPMGETTRIEHRFDIVGARPCPQAAEFTMASLVVVASQLCGEPVHALSVEFEHAALDKVDAYRSVFGVVPRFECPVTCLVLASELLDRPVPGADPGLSRIVTSHAEQVLTVSLRPPENITARVRRELTEGMAHGRTSLQAVARRLNLSERSLQRRLDDQGTCFAALMDDVRRDLAMRYIADGRLALGEVAYLLGFADPSSFHRAFKRWTGMTPAAARRSRL
ncbi:MAG: AraC family transcriptional regulator [Caldimonas sp.]|uniref:AraC family transcriptional regulator n=1 Tax=Caldimonas sp. TaxID=2838790 RepID=UPI00391A96FE